MTALRLPVSPAVRLPASFATALLVHVLALVALPTIGRWVERASMAAAPPLELPPSPPGEVIPIKLPQSSSFELVTELGSIKRSTAGKQGIALPSASAARGTALSLSASLADAARQAQAAYERLHPQAETTRFVAELRLAGSGLAVARDGAAKRIAPATPAPAGALPDRQQALRERERRAQAQPAQEPKAPPRSEPPVRAEAPSPAPKPATSPPPPEPIRALPAEERPTPMIYAPEPEAPRRPLQPPAGPDMLAESGPVQAYRGPLPDVIADAPQLPAPGTDSFNAPVTAGGPVVGEGAAPERGPGEPVANRMVFFQRLTNHLFQVNQQVLAEAIRATPRLTVEVHFRIDRNGRVIEAAVTRSTGSAQLDDKAVSVVQRASPVPRLPPDMPQQQLELSFPVQIYR